METSKQGNLISLNTAAYDQWQSVGLAEGLLADTDIAMFLIQMYDSSKENGQLFLHCVHCPNLISLLCDTCKQYHPQPLSANRKEEQPLWEQEAQEPSPETLQSSEQACFRGQKSVASLPVKKTTDNAVSEYECKSLNGVLESFVSKNRSTYVQLQQPQSGTAPHPVSTLQSGAHDVGENHDWSLEQMTALHQYVGERRRKRKTNSFWQTCANALNAEFGVSWSVTAYKAQYSKREGVFTCVHSSSDTCADQVAANTRSSDRARLTLRASQSGVGQTAPTFDTDDMVLFNEHHMLSSRETRTTLCEMGEKITESFPTGAEADSEPRLKKHARNLKREVSGEIEETVSFTQSSALFASKDMEVADNASTEVTWHYLGGSDVEIPDFSDSNRKRKLYKRSLADRFKCKDCGSCFSHRSKLVQHIRMVHLKWRPHFCELCCTSFPSKSRLNRHINVVHTNTRPFCCETCGVSFVDHYTLTHHKLTHEENRQYRYFCELCGKGYHRMGELKQHMETHSSGPIKSLLCWVCGKAVRTARYLRIHLRTHSPDKAHTCSECCQVFTSKYSLNKHKKSLVCQKRDDKNTSLLKHSRMPARKKQIPLLNRKKPGKIVGTFPCEICDKYFSVKKDVYRHKRNIHGIEVRRTDQIVVTDPEEIARFLTPKKRGTTDLKFSCEICFQRYSSQENVRKHRDIVHLGKRDYSCDLCNKTFTRASSLKEHKDFVHNPTGVQCDICHKTFSSKTNMIKHKKVLHYGFKPHCCPACSKTFRDNYKLRKHQQSCGRERRTLTLQEETGKDPTRKTKAGLHTISNSVRHHKEPESSTVSMETLFTNTSPVLTSVTTCTAGLPPVSSPWSANSGTVTSAPGPTLKALGAQTQDLSVSPHSHFAVGTVQSTAVWKQAS